MNLLFDTNIILTLVRSKDYKGMMDYLNPENRLIYVSIVSEAEIKSIALRSNWSDKRRKKLDLFLDQVFIVDISHEYVICAGFILGSQTGHN